MTYERLAIDAMGWGGAAIILAAYFLLSAGRLDGRSYRYQWMNVIGSICFIVNSGYHHAMPSAWLNVIWAGIGLYTLWAIAHRPKAML